MLIRASFIKYVVAFNVVYWPIRQVVSESVAIWVAFASWPLVWWVARRRRRAAFYDNLARKRLIHEDAGDSPDDPNSH